MSKEDFMSLVRSMRECQREYFKTRSSDALKASKRLEKQVDEAVSEYFSQQLSLFEKEIKQWVT